MILANRTPGDNKAITALGDMLKEYGWIHAAHICYILSPQTSIQSGVDTPNSRYTLLGYDHAYNQLTRSFHDWEALQLTEIYEFGLSLKSNEAGLPFLQPYKLIYAWWLADCGYLNEARRYCESIANIVKVYSKGSPYFHGCFLQKLKDLTQRLLEHGGNNHNTNESPSWLFAKKMPKATLDSLWGSLEGRFNKFVAGDNADESGEKPSDSQEVVGPFSHFSAITQPTSNVPSRSSSAVDFRSASDSTAFNMTSQRQVDGRQRRSSTPGVNAHADALAVNGYRSNTLSPVTFDGQTSISPVPEGQPSSTENANHYGYSSYSIFQSSETENLNAYQSGSNLYDQQAQPGYNTISSYDHDTTSNTKQQNKDQSTYPFYNPSENTNNSGWWGSSYSGAKYDQKQQVNSLEGEFVSPMGNSFTQFSPAPEPVTSTTDNNANNANWDDDDLGLGNHSFAKKKSGQNVESKDSSGNDEHTEPPESPVEKNENEKKEEDKKGWFGRWFGKKEGGGGKAANLGEESSFYFDPVQNKWVNKKGGSDSPTTLAPPPPPPSRAKTTSPTPSASMMNPKRQSMPLESIPAKQQSLPPISSPLINNSNSSASTPPPGGRRSASSASTRRPVRARYVDIMNQPPSQK